MEFDYPAFPIVWHKHWQVLVSELWNKKKERESCSSISQTEQYQAQALSDEWLCSTANK
jgi:hypothetical protein